MLTVTVVVTCCSCRPVLTGAPSTARGSVRWQAVAKQAAVKQPQRQTGLARQTGTSARHRQANLQTTARWCRFTPCGGDGRALAQARAAKMQTTAILLLLITAATRQARRAGVGTTLIGASRAICPGQQLKGKETFASPWVGGGRKRPGSCAAGQLATCRLTSID